MTVLRSIRFRTSLPLSKANDLNLFLSFTNSVPCGGARGGARVPVCPRSPSCERYRVWQPDRPPARVHAAADRGPGGRVTGGAVRAAVPPQAGTHGQRGTAAGEREEEQISGYFAV